MTVADTASAARPLGVSVTAEGPRPQRSLKVLFVNDYLPQEMLGIMWLSRSIKDAGHQTAALFLPDKDWIEKLHEHAPDVVCFSVTTGMHLYSFDVAKRIKTQNGQEKSWNLVRCLALLKCVKVPQSSNFCA